MRCHHLLRLLARALVCAVAASTAAFAQEPGGEGRVELSGRVVTAEGVIPLPGVVVTIEEREATAVTDEDGRFRFSDQPPGTIHVVAAIQGFEPTREEVVLVAAPVEITITMRDDLHFTEAVSVSPQPRDPFESYQPTSVLSGQELAIKLDSSLGAMLREEPGVAERSLGAGPSRPVIRGQDGDRVLILQNSQRTGDISSQSADHGVTLNPAAATQVEVVRGPATLLYGANAIGGLVNVISEQIPTRPVAEIVGRAQVDLATNAGQAGTAADVSVGNGRWVLNAGGSATRAGDFSTPIGEIDNSATRGAFGSIGLSRTSTGGYLGASVAIDDTRYGVPVVEDGGIELNPRRRVLSVRGERRNLDGLFDSVRASMAHHRYRHEELHDGVPATFFRNDLFDVDVRATHGPVGRVTGTVGVSGYGRHFDVEGAEDLSPRVDQQMLSLFTYQEASWAHATVQFGGRYDRASYDPRGGLRARDFHNLSLSAGTLLRPTDRSVIAVNVARAARNPALEELYFFGPHPGNFTFEIGNADLKSEVAYGLDVSYRLRLPRVSAEFSYFDNVVNDYIFRNPISEEEFDRRFPDVAHPGHDHDHDDHDHGGDEGHEGHAHGDLPIIEFTGRNARLNGFEAHADIDVVHGLHIELGFDSVRGTLRGTGEALPRMPPVRFTSGMRYHRNALQLGAQVVVAADQDRVHDVETRTPGYGVLKLFGAYSFPTGGLVSTITVRLDNATDRLYRNHLSYIKDLVPERGRNFRVVYGVSF
jgi:iron complex outermembrane receptor protein